MKEKFWKYFCLSKPCWAWGQEPKWMISTLGWEGQVPLFHLLACSSPSHTFGNVLCEWLEQWIKTICIILVNGIYAGSFLLVKMIKKRTIVSLWHTCRELWFISVLVDSCDIRKARYFPMLEKIFILHGCLQAITQHLEIHSHGIKQGLGFIRNIIYVMLMHPSIQSSEQQQLSSGTDFFAELCKGGDCFFESGLPS